MHPPSPAALSIALLAALAPLAAAAPRSAQDPGRRGDAHESDELAALLAEERAEADRLRRRGDDAGALRILGRHLRDEPGDAASRALRARVRRGRAEVDAARADAERALDDAAAGPAALRALCARELSALLLELGRPGDALAALDRARADLSPGSDARDAWLYARANEELGQREEAERLFRAGADGPDGQGWEGLLARARCQRRLGLLEPADRSLVLADRQCAQGAGVEPDVLVELGALYFEADREVDAASQRSARRLFDQALAHCPGHEGALLGLFELHRTNWKRTSRSASEILAEVLERRPDSIAGLLAACAADLDDGDLKAARARLARLEELAPRRRDVRTERAALAWIENERERCERLLAELRATDARDGRPEREVGRHLVELYRFAEGRPFLEHAVERDPQDHRAWTLLGRALANVGDEEAARAALTRARAEAGLRRDAWRDNTARVLERIEREARVDEFGEHSFVWRADAAEVLGTYLVPFYAEAREELARRYGFSPGPVRIEVFREHADFSVRSTGFEGFPALGVCFGPVVTALSPLCELRGHFSWARTSFHEFTHVIHLGLSRNRCPRWITEGLATWEEAQKDPSWDRNLRRELVDALANGEIIPVRELNRAFRGPRIIFGYYQGGLVCEMLIGRFGFPAAVRLLEAFDRGLDLDGALDEVCGLTPEQLDRDLEAFAREKVAGLSIEPRWRPELLPRLRLGLSREPPADEEGLERWSESWCTIAWGQWQAGRRVDAEAALREVRRGGRPAPRAEFLRGEMALAAGDEEAAVAAWELAFELGGEDFRARVALGSVLWKRGDEEDAERHFLAAERAFPGFDETALAAEMKLHGLLGAQGRTDESFAALERYLAWDASDFSAHLRVADWHARNGRWEEALRGYGHANEVDPFVRRLHDQWAAALTECGRWEEALREVGVALIVPPELDLDQPAPLTPAQRAQRIGLEARCLLELGRVEEALERAREALELDGDCEPAAAVLAEARK